MTTQLLMTEDELRKMEKDLADRMSPLGEFDSVEVTDFSMRAAVKLLREVRVLRRALLDSEEKFLTWHKAA